jgi:hypothetical protein
VKLTVGSILLIVAVVIFLAVALGFNVGNVELLPLGLAALAGGLLFDRR